MERVDRSWELLWSLRNTPVSVAHPYFQVKDPDSSLQGSRISHKALLQFFERCSNVFIWISKGKKFQANWKREWIIPQREILLTIHTWYFRITHATRSEYLRTGGNPMWTEKHKAQQEWNSLLGFSAVDLVKVHPLRRGCLPSQQFLP